ncbi:MAG: transcription elongation factor GreB [Gammaproteobacteria bacterium]|nr:transcription elongation factor GreB [Gammaproteobacteria bacterium]MCY4356549.1 transcription elongation factor GreB [Gammaproteobacteria bacterium]
MGRYHPPGKPGAKYITPAGEQALRQELHTLWKTERPKVTQSVSDAAALGDRSENAEYIYGKKRLREIDRRVRYLSKRLDEVIVVRSPPEDKSKVFFGATVTLEDKSGQTFRYRLVGPDEIDPQRGYISIDSPMGRELLGKRVDTEFEISLASGVEPFVVLAIDYLAHEYNRSGNNGQSGA